MSTAAAFVGDFDAREAGRYDMMLDVSQATVRRYHVEIRGATTVDLSNRWLPATTSWFLDLKPGNRHAKFVVSVCSRIEPTSAVGRQFAERNLFLPGTQWVDFFNIESHPQID